MILTFLHSSWRRLHSALVWLVLLPVLFYRRVLSPMKRAPSCRFVPSCSEYAVQAVRTRGVLVGGGLALWRIARCQPLCRGGYDPVRNDAACCGQERS